MKLANDDILKMAGKNYQRGKKKIKITARIEPVDLWRGLWTMLRKITLGSDSPAHLKLQTEN